MIILKHASPLPLPCPHVGHRLLGPCGLGTSALGPLCVWLCGAPALGPYVTGGTGFGPLGVRGHSHVRVTGNISG